MTDKRRKKKRKNIFMIYLEYLGFRVLERFFYYLPSLLAYPFASFLSGLIFLLDSKHRKRTIINLMHAGIVADKISAKKLARQNFKHFSYMLVDIIKAPKFFKTPQDIVNIVKPVAEDDVINRFLTPGKSDQAIIVTAHFGNWECAGAAYCCLSGRKMLTIMRDFDNPLIGDYFVRRREIFGHKVISKKWALKEMLKAVADGYSICFLADQYPGDQEGVIVKFFGHDVRTHSAPAILHMKKKIPIVVGACRRTKMMKYEMLGEKPILPEDSASLSVAEITQLYTEKLEKIIRNNPEQWLWAHRRWRDLKYEENV